MGGHIRGSERGTRITTYENSRLCVFSPPGSSMCVCLGGAYKVAMPALVTSAGIGPQRLLSVSWLQVMRQWRATRRVSRSDGGTQHRGPEEGDCGTVLRVRTATMAGAPPPPRCTRPRGAHTVSGAPPCLERRAPTGWCPSVCCWQGSCRWWRTGGARQRGHRGGRGMSHVSLRARTATNPPPHRAAGRAASAREGRIHCLERHHVPQLRRERAPVKEIKGAGMWWQRGGTEVAEVCKLTRVHRHQPPYRAAGPDAPAREARIHVYEIRREHPDFCRDRGKVVGVAAAAWRKGGGGATEGGQGRQRRVSLRVRTATNPSHRAAGTAASAGEARVQILERHEQADLRRDRARQLVGIDPALGWGARDEPTQRRAGGAEACELARTHRHQTSTAPRGQLHPSARRAYSVVSATMFPSSAGMVPASWLTWRELQWGGGGVQRHVILPHPPTAPRGDRCIRPRGAHTAA
jgi:hypothetical protein